MASLAERIVWALPVLNNPAATFRGWQLHRRRYGAVYQAAIPEIEARASWSVEQMREYVDAEVRRVVQLAATHVPYYRELFAREGIRASEIRGVADLPRIPPLEKSTVRTNPEQFLNETIPAGQLVRGSTSGTTGTPLLLYHSSRVIQLHSAYYEVRCRRAAGIEFGHRPSVTLAARLVAPSNRTRPPFWCYNYVHRQLYMSSYHLADRYLRSYVRELRRRPYHAIQGFPSSLYALARYVLDHEPAPLRLGVASTSGEVLFDWQRAAIEQGLGCRVFDQYGSNEYCVLAAEHGDGRMYLSPDYGVVEVIDAAGQPVTGSQPGDLLCTSLVNDAQVFLRYRIGDRAALSASRSALSPALPMLEHIEGRTNQALLMRDGRRIWRLAMMNKVRNVQECQVVQHDWDDFSVRVVPAPGYRPEDGQQLARNLQQRIGTVNVRVVLEDMIERGPGGKFHMLVCKLAALECAPDRSRGTDAP